MYMYLWYQIVWDFYSLLISNINKGDFHFYFYKWYFNTVPLFLSGLFKYDQWYSKYCSYILLYV